MLKHIRCIILPLLLLLATSSHAVLKERDISSSLSILRQELNNYRHDLDKQQNDLRLQQQMVVKELITVGNQSQQNALMLYSQKEGNIFDLTYACHAATEQYKQFRNNAAPFRDYITNTNTEVSRYDSLINDLSNMYIGALTPKAKLDRNVCLTLAINIRRTLADNNDQMKQYITLYNRTEEGLKNLNDYANMRYGEIQRSIFNNGGENYLMVLHNLRKEYNLTLTTVLMKYRPVHHALSEWDGRVILGFFIALFIGVLIAAGLNYLVIGFIFTYLVKHGKIDFLFHWFDKRKASIQAPSPFPNSMEPSGEAADDLEMIHTKASFNAKRRTIIATSTVITFALMLGLLRQAVAQNFFVMATGLLMEFTWLMAAILLSLLIRLDGAQIKNGLRIYAPVLTVCFLVIGFRIILIPNTLVNLIFPPMLFICAVWQWLVVKHYQKALRRSLDMVDDAADLYPDDHLRVVAAQGLWQQSAPSFLRQGHVDHAYVALPFLLLRPASNIRSTVHHSVDLLGRRRVQPQRHHAANLQHASDRHEELHLLHLQGRAGGDSLLSLLLFLPHVAQPAPSPLRTE